MHLAADGFCPRQFLIRISFLGDQLPANRRCCQACVEPLGLEGGIRLTLTIDNAADIDEQVGQVFFALLASARGKAIQTPDPTAKLMRPFADRASIPDQLAFGAALPLVAKESNRASHEPSPFTPFQLLNRSLQILLDRVREFHENGSSMSKDAILLG
jgi:hypothetical protein